MSVRYIFVGKILVYLLMPPDSLVLIVVILCNQETLRCICQWCGTVRAWEAHSCDQKCDTDTTDTITGQRKLSSIFICSQHDSLEPQHASWDIMARKCNYTDGKILKMWWEPCQSEMFADKEAHTYLLTGLLFVQVKVWLISFWPG